MSQGQQVQTAINAIRAISQLYSDDISALVAVLSCKVANDPNKHLKLHGVAVDSLDDLANYLNDVMAEAA